MLIIPAPREAEAAGAKGEAQTGCITSYGDVADKKKSKPDTAVLH